MTYEEIKGAASVLASAADYDVAALSDEKKARLYAYILAIEAAFKTLKDAMKGNLVQLDKEELKVYGLTKAEATKYDFSGNKAYAAAKRGLDKATKALDKAKEAMPEYIALSQAQAAFDEAYDDLDEKKAVDAAKKKLAGAEATAKQTMIDVVKTVTYTLKRA